MSADPATGIVAPVAGVVRRALLIDASSRDLRRTLGPSTWLVFEELLLCSTGDGEQVVARVSVRSLAGSLGLAKDTVARAIGRLRAEGLVTAAPQRVDTGLFTTGTYRITTPDSVRPVVASCVPSSNPMRPVAEPRPSRPPASIRSVAVPRASRRAPVSRPASVVAQLALVFEA